MTADFQLSALPQLRSVQVFGRRICYYDIGQGPPLVLVHGAGGDADQWAFCYAGLAARRRVIALDLLGFGRSDKPLIDYRIAGYVEVLDRFVAALSIDRAAFLGHSLGGWIAAEFALQFPQKVHRLVLNDAAGIDEGAVALPVDLNVSSRGHMRKVFEAMFHDRSIVSDGLVDLAYALHLERNDGYTIRSVLETIAAPGEKLDGRIGGISMPTLLLWGEQDAITPLPMAHAYLRKIPGARLHVIAQCGHLPPLEKSREFVDAVTQFLDR
jgi:pimeloyl-ACP methyl ester carboxylesterase